MHAADIAPSLSAAHGGEWVGEALSNLKPKVLCGSCYDLAKHFHSGGDPWA